MTYLREAPHEPGRTGLAATLEQLFVEALPVRLAAPDGSSAGPAESPWELALRNERALSYLLTAPGDLGLARAYAAGDLEINGVHPGDPYPVLTVLLDRLSLRVPAPQEALKVIRSVGVRNLVPPSPPPQEHLPRWRRVVEGLRHSPERDAEAIEHHYDVSNRFYACVLGESMAYTCAVFPGAEADLETAQRTKFDLVARKLELRPGQRLLDIGCGWGSMAIHAAREYGVEVLGVTLSRAQASWARDAVAEAGVGGQVEIRLQDYRDVREDGFDAVCSIGMMEHVGVRHYPEYFRTLSERLRPGGRLLNHSITRPDNRPTETGAFIDRYIFPDGELTGSGRIVSEAEDAGLEVLHSENLRHHYALTLQAWSQNLETHWDECVSEVGEGTAKVWGLFLAGSRLGFERNKIQLHQVLARRADSDDAAGPDLTVHW